MKEERKMLDCCKVCPYTCIQYDDLTGFYGCDKAKRELLDRTEPSEDTAMDRDVGLIKIPLPVGFDDKMAEELGIVTKKQLDEIPSADVAEVKHGRWVDNHCSLCGMTPIDENLYKSLNICPPKCEYYMNYCPHCGAIMDDKGGER